MSEDNVLIEVSVQIIVHAGEVRNEVERALSLAEDFDFAAARKHLDRADEELLKAHKAQTNIIQAEADGKTYEPCILFNHAQDTLMTVMTELRLGKKLVSLIEMLDKTFERKQV